MVDRNYAHVLDVHNHTALSLMSPGKNNTHGSLIKDKGTIFVIISYVIINTYLYGTTRDEVKISMPTKQLQHRQSACQGTNTNNSRPMSWRIVVWDSKALRKIDISDRI